MNTPAIIQNIQQQAPSLFDVLQYQRGDGGADLLRAAELIRSRKRVVITAMGASLFAAIPLAYHLRAHGVDATAVEAGELLHFPQTGLTGAVILMVSRSGASVEVARLAARLAPDNTIIAVTNEPGSPLAHAAHARLVVTSRTDEMVAIQTYTGTLLTLYLLGCAVTGSLEKAYRDASDGIGQFRTLVANNLKNIEAWDTFLDVHSPVHLLARGPSVASACEGALLFNEVAKHPSCAMPVASFRHGPVELVDRSFRGFVFAGLDAVCTLNIALAKDLQSFGGQVHMIGSSPEPSSSLAWSELPAAAEPLLPLFEVVPLQVAAVRMAQLRGIPLGVFRFATQVALDETSFGKK